MGFKLPLLSILGLLAVVFVQVVLSQNCPFGKVVIKEIHDATPGEIQSFINAYFQLHRTPSRQYPQYSLLEELTIIHNDNRIPAHHNALFYFWHRYFCGQLFIQYMKEMDPQVTFVYWAWEAGQESYNPENSIVFQWFGSAYLAPDGSAGCVRDSPWNSLRFKYDNSDCLRRGMNMSDPTNRLQNDRYVAQLQAQYTDYDSYRQVYEATAHAAVHVLVGGSQLNAGQMAYMISPLDIFFWAHHFNVERHFLLWQRANDPFYSQYDGLIYTGARAQPSDIIPPFNVTVKSVMDPTKMCYSFQEPIALGPKPVSSPNDLSGISLPFGNSTTNSTNPGTPPVNNNATDSGTPPVNNNTTNTNTTDTGKHRGNGRQRVPSAKDIWVQPSSGQGRQPFSFFLALNTDQPTGTNQTGEGPDNATSQDAISSANGTQPGYLPPVKLNSTLFMRDGVLYSYPKVKRNNRKLVLPDARWLRMNQFSPQEFAAINASLTQVVQNVQDKLNKNLPCPPVGFTAPKDTLIVVPRVPQPSDIRVILGSDSNNHQYPTNYTSPPSQPPSSTDPASKPKKHCGCSKNATTY